ncbi:MAG: PAS domain-containing protein, partial [Methanomicrobium sp.]|nr:PAS domain-containing protein [Methanomicrobium sp.]
MNFGSLKIACIYSRDISVNKSHEERIKRSEEEKTLILNSVHENLVYYDLDFKIIWANKEPAESVNLRPEELTGKTCYELWYNRASPCEDCTIKKAMTAKTPVTEEKTRKDGRCKKVSAYPVFDENKNLTGAVESVLDISRRKKPE